MGSSPRPWRAGAEAQCVHINLHCIYFHASGRKAKSPFVLVDVYPCWESRGWLAERSQELISWQISQQWLSPSSASPAMHSHRPCRGWNLQRSLYSHCIPVPALICESAPADQCRAGQEVLAGKEEMPAVFFFTPDHLHIFSPMCSEKFSLDQSGGLHSVLLMASFWLLTVETLICRGSSSSPPAWLFPLFFWNWSELQSLLLECRAWPHLCCPGCPAVNLHALLHPPQQRCLSEADSWWRCCLSSILPVSELLLARMQG